MGRPSTPRAELLRRRRNRRRVVITLATTISLGMLGTVGYFAGAGVGIVTEQIRERWPAADPPLAATKVTPPRPVDISGPAVACSALALELVVQPDRTQITPGEAIGISVEVNHIGRYPCLVNGGQENLRLRVVSADGVTAWTSYDCDYSGERKLLIGPGYSFDFAAGWDGHASAPGRCSEGQAALGPGTWYLIASLAEVAHSDSTPVAIVIQAAVPAPPVIVEPEEPSETAEIGVVEDNGTGEGDVIVGNAESTGAAPLTTDPTTPGDAVESTTSDLDVPLQD
ncbi:MAG: hypothetical protein FWG25_07035 [Promicromonosporaceae bacterium]|nr:hypothetical protein [Promicromonosporaceae bacterium]